MCVCLVRPAEGEVILEHLDRDSRTLEWSSCLQGGRGSGQVCVCGGGGVQVCVGWVGSGVCVC